MNTDGKINSDEKPVHLAEWVKGAQEKIALVRLQFVSRLYEAVKTSFFANTVELGKRTGTVVVSGAYVLGDAKVKLGDIENYGQVIGCVEHLFEADGVKVSTDAFMTEVDDPDIEVAQLEYVIFTITIP